MHDPAATPIITPIAVWPIAGLAWKLWQTGQIYDQTYHLQQRALRTKVRSA
jgi:hypothetical protein